MSDTPTSDPTAPAYRVLARKYRPVTFAELIGQEAMVRTLTNAIASGRLAHAFILTGVRGVGKTTTARIIARALNCVGPDGKGGPTIQPCGVCEFCKAIAEDRHMDVLEMDAASRTGVDDIRELIDGVRYRPTSARYKVYIIDEVHMLSKNAFNALLKTLEEPPAHVKFIFATTEIRKVPVTVLSRCQRFDLRRIDVDRLVGHFKALAEKEGVDIADGAIHLIARAADGSVRDGLSLLDQAIAHGTGRIDEGEVRRMLGLADRTITFDILDAVMGGKPAQALELLASQYESGADPVQVLQDLLELVHWLTRVKVVPEAASDPSLPEAERVRGQGMSAKLAMATLTRAWQMLLKGLQEVMNAASSLQAAEMVLIRLAYVSDLPSPADVVGASGGAVASRPAAAPASSAPMSAPAPRSEARAPSHSSSPVPTARTATAPRVEASPVTEAVALADPKSFEEVVALAEARKEQMLASTLRNNVHLVSFDAGRIEFRPTDHAPRDLANQLSRLLNEATARRWVVTVSGDEGQATLRQQADAATDEARLRAQDDPVVKAMLEQFPGAKISAVRRLNTSATTQAVTDSGEPMSDDPEENLEID